MFGFNALKYFSLSTAQQPLVDQDSLVEASRSQSDTHSVGFLWTSDRPVAKTSAWQHTTLTRDRLPCSPAGFKPAIPARERPQSHANLDSAATWICLLNNAVNKYYGAPLDYTVVPGRAPRIVLITRCDCMATHVKQLHVVVVTDMLNY